jgi:hypothetical protein
MPGWCQRQRGFLSSTAVGASPPGREALHVRRPTTWKLLGRGLYYLPVEPTGLVPVQTTTESQGDRSQHSQQGQSDPAGVACTPVQWHYSRTMALFCGRSDGTFVP